MCEAEYAVLREKRAQAVSRHYSLNTFLCGENTMLTLFRDDKVVTYAHGRSLKIGDLLTIRRIVPTDKDVFVVRVIQIHEKFDFIILEGNETMSVSSPGLYQPFPRSSSVVCYDKDEGHLLSLQKVDLLKYTDHQSIFWKGVSNQKPPSSPEGGGCYEEDCKELWGICVGYQQVQSETEGNVSNLYEYSICVGGMFY